LDIGQQVGGRYKVQAVEIAPAPSEDNIPENQMHTPQ
jgi:hypothetical protein